MSGNNWGDGHSFTQDHQDTREFEATFDKYAETATKFSIGRLFDTVLKGALCLFVLFFGCLVLISAIGGDSQDSYARDLIKNGRAAKTAGDNGAARSSFEDVIHSASRDSVWSAVARFELATMLYEKEDYQSARQSFQQVMENANLPREEYLKSALMVTECCYFEKDFDTIRYYTTELLKENDTTDELRARALFFRACVRSEDGLLEDAIKDQTEALELAEGFTDLQSQIQFNRAINFEKLGRTREEMADYAGVITRGTARTDILAWAYHNQGVTHLQNEQYDLAVSDFTSELDVARDAPDMQVNAQKALGTVYQNRAASLAKNGQLEEAIADCTTGLELTQGLTDSQSRLQYNRAVYHSQLQNLELAQADYLKVIERGTTEVNVLANAHNNLGVFYLNAEQLDKALQEFEAAFGLENATAESQLLSLYNIDLVCQTNGRHDRSLALAEKVCLRTDLTVPQQAQAVLLRGLNRLRCGQTTAGQQDLKKARAIAERESLIDIVEQIESLNLELTQATSGAINR